MRVRRNDSSPKLELPINLPPPKVNAGTSAPSGSLTERQFEFAGANPISELIGSSAAGGTSPGLPGLTHPKIEISEESTAALLEMANEDPALYGRIIQHMNGLDRSKTWTVSLDAFANGSVSNTQNARYQAQLEKSLSESGLGAGGQHTSYFKGVVEYESVEATTVLAEPKPGNEAEVKALLEDIQGWNQTYASSFAFENDVGSRTSNPETEAAAIEALVQILEQHGAVLEGATIELSGFTSTPGTDAHNQSLSEERAATISKALEVRLAGTELEGKIVLGSAGYGETKPLDTHGQPVPLGEDGRPIDPALEDPARSRRVEVLVTVDPLVVAPEPGQSIVQREGAGVILEIKAQPEGGGGGHHRRVKDHVTKSRISQRIGGEIPCKNWMSSLLRP